jgi:mannose-6-phosphate isomerase-like protein (cupin superfamily)
LLKAKASEVVFKHDTYGPGYLARGPYSDVGIIQLRPGDDYRNHYHAHSENAFFTLEGEVVLWSNCRDRFLLGPGDFHRCDPGEMHYFVNEGTVPWRAFFLRVPYDPADTIVVPWRPARLPPIARPGTDPP